MTTPEEQICKFTPDNIVNAMLESESKWRVVRKYVEIRSAGRRSTLRQCDKKIHERTSK